MVANCLAFIQRYYIGTLLFQKLTKILIDEDTKRGLNLSWELNLVPSLKPWWYTCYSPGFTGKNGVKDLLETVPSTAPESSSQGWAWSAILDGDAFTGES